jgi:peroxiredoxin
MMKKIAMFALALLFVPVFVASVGAADLKVGDMLPEFSLKGESGKVYNLEAVKGKKVVFTFTQAACSACRGEIVLLNDLAKEAKDTVILPVSVDMGGAKALQQYKQDYNITFDFLLDPEFTFPRVFGFSYTPSTALIGADGKIVALLGGYNDMTAGKIKEFVKK